ncbi:MAG: ABC transporter ATP-binding protein [Anaerolineaceae bacterium]|nr:ABC transporter ATP-binding protein [Anaerolineaceae bacterium]
MMSQTDVVIQTHNLSKSFDGHEVLSDLDLFVPRNSIVGFLGPNGAGKSTTIKLLLGLLRPTRGGGEIFGMDIVADSARVRQRIGFLAQQPRFDQRMTAREVLEFTARFFYRGSQPLIRERVNEMLHLVGLEEKADRVVKGFSGGEMQRLGIAQAQVNYPDLLILDEPAAALDPMGRADVLQIMEKLRKYTTIFYSTHILDDVQKVSDRVVILDHGRMVSQGPIEQLLAVGDGTVYTLELNRASENALRLLRAQKWVSDVRVQSVNSHTRWLVSVDDDAAAEAQLLRLLLAEEGLNVITFSKQQFELEDVFMQLVEGNGHHG